MVFNSQGQGILSLTREKIIYNPTRITVGQNVHY